MRPQKNRKLYYTTGGENKFRRPFLFASRYIMVLSRPWLKPVILASALVLLWLAFTWVSYLLLWIPNENRFDFYPRWMGARAVLNHRNPYATEVTREIQIGMFDAPRAANQDQQAFAYPAWIAWQLLPFWLLPFPIAVSAWCGLALLLLIVSPLVIFSLLDWKIPPLALAVVLFLSVFVFRYPMITYFFGQFTPFVLACFVFAWWAMAHQHQVLAALGLLLAMVRPELALVPLCALLVLAWQLKQRRVIFFWLGGMGALWLLTRVWLGAWELDFYQGILAYRAYAIPVWGPSLLNNFMLSIALVVGVIGWSIWMWFRVRRVETSERIGWILSASLLAGLIWIPQTANYTLVLALGAVWFLFGIYREKYIYWLPLVLILLAPWFFAASNPSWTNWERLLIPLGLCIVLTHGWFFRNTRARNISAMLHTASISP